jgi:PBSX family phage terminase large subunit
MANKIRVQGGVNLEFLLNEFSFEKANAGIKQGFVLEGSSGSGKTFDIINFFLIYCQNNYNKNKDILIFREAFTDVRKTVLKDFEKILRMYNLYNPELHRKSTPVSFELFGNKMYFSGLDSMSSHGERHDVIWGNEGMELNFDAWKQLNQRCNECFITDYNPSYTDHWIFNSLITRPDTKFFHSTLLNNTFLPEGQRKEILSYEPTAENIKNGTADDYMWKVYGLGLRSAPKGLIFPHVNWINEMPEGEYFYGLDFGFTNDPTALTKIYLQGNNLFVELLLYEPIDSAVALSDYLNEIKIPKGVTITADCSDKYNDLEMVKDLRNFGWNVNKTSKAKGILYRLGLLKKHKINIVYNINAKREQENYKWREINGINVNEPIDKFNHFWDSLGYGYMGKLKSSFGF